LRKREKVKPGLEKGGWKGESREKFLKKKTEKEALNKRSSQNIKEKKRPGARQGAQQGPGLVILGGV